MHHIIKIILSILLILLITLGTGSLHLINAQLNISSQDRPIHTSPDTSGFQFSNAYLGARSVALANTHVADAYSLEGIFTNPAAFIFSESNTLISTNAFYSTHHNVSVENLNAVLFRNSEHLFAMGGSVQHNNPDDFSLANQQVTQINFYQYDVSMFYATKISPTFSIGGGLIGSYGTTNYEADYALRSNLGVFYAPSSSVSYGLAYTGFAGIVEGLGTRLRYAFTREFSDIYEGELFTERFDDEDKIRRTELIREDLPHRLEVGAALRFPTMSRQPDYKLLFANEKIFGEPGLIYKVGLEVFPYEILALRGGYVISPDENGGSFGFGLVTDFIALDYSFSQTMIGIHSYSHMLSLSIGLNL